MLSEYQKNDYLKRINVSGDKKLNFSFLENIHQSHLLSIPFENFDILLGEKITLDSKSIYEKIVSRHRGGFCYELNGCLYSLLKSLGFDVKVISARVYDGSKIGPEFDHLCLIVKLGNIEYLVDVGFGGSFRIPFKVDGSVSAEKYSGFRVDKNEGRYILLKSNKENIWIPQYDFTLSEYSLSDFSSMCDFHQTSVDSHFTKNTICTHATKGSGRVTLSNNKKIITEKNIRTESMINSLDEYVGFLSSEFEIKINDYSKMKKWFLSTEAEGT